MARKHILIYHENGKLINTTPRKWARKYKSYFPNYNFTDKQNNHPITNEIISYLENNFSFESVYDNTIAIHYNLNIHLNF